MLLLIPCFIFPFYEVVEDKDIFINNYEPFAIGGNSKITFFETAWDYKNSYDNFLSKIKLKTVKKNSGKKELYLNFRKSLIQGINSLRP